MKASCFHGQKPKTQTFASGLVIFRKKDGRCRPIRFRDNPEPNAVTVGVGGENATAEIDSLIIGLSIFFRNISPIARNMSDKRVAHVILVYAVERTRGGKDSSNIDLDDESFHYGSHGLLHRVKRTGLQPVLRSVNLLR
jgi:hypothetical protein